MATPMMDVSMLNYFSPIFIFILIFAFVYGALHKTKVLGYNKILSGIIGLIIGLVFVLISPLTKVVLLIAPWFSIFFIFLLFVIVVFKIFGATDDNITTVIKRSGLLQWTLIIICLVIAIGALAAVFGQQSLEEGYGPKGPGIGDGGEVSIDGEVISVGAPGYPGAGASTATGNYGSNLAATLYHPKTLGVIFILIIAALAGGMLTGKMSPSWP